MNDFNKPRPTQSKPFVAKGHDAILKRFQDGHSLVEVELQSGRVIVGEMIARDKFSITLRVNIEGKAKDQTIYKHAIETFNLG